MDFVFYSSHFIFSLISFCIGVIHTRLIYHHIIHSEVALFMCSIGLFSNIVLRVLFASAMLDSDIDSIGTWQTNQFRNICIYKIPPAPIIPRFNPISNRSRSLQLKITQNLDPSGRSLGYGQSPPPTNRVTGFTVYQCYILHIEYEDLLNWRWK